MQGIALQSPILEKKNPNNIDIPAYKYIYIALPTICISIYDYLWIRWKSHDSKQWHSRGTPQITGHGEEVADGLGQAVHHVRVRQKTVTIHQQDPGCNKEW